MTYDFAIVGGGIVGLASARAIADRRRGASIVVLEKEAGWATHQTGRNSGVIHSGLYYRAGTLRARLAVAGNRSMADFCSEHGIAHRICGKLVVAVSDDEVPRLKKLEESARANGVAAEWLDGDAARRFEPHVSVRAALHVPSTGVVDFRAVAVKLAGLLEGRSDLRLSCCVRRIVDERDSMLIETSDGEIRARRVINCAGLFSDRVARSSGAAPGVRIIPFRGEYYTVGGGSESLVKGLIYPVPDPAFPFLGVHLTRGVEGHVHAGPNAVLALAREGYTWSAISLRDLADTLTYGGFWRLAGRHWRMGIEEMTRSLSQRLFARSVQRLVPEIAESDLTSSPAGVRAQALAPTGALADDFVIVPQGRALHVCNAPSPAATAALEIGRHVAEMATNDER